jgi:hypothetical protein
MEGDAAKIFIASDLDAGAVKLADPSLLYIVSGGFNSRSLFRPIRFDWCKLALT